MSGGDGSWWTYFTRFAPSSYFWFASSFPTCRERPCRGRCRWWVSVWMLTIRNTCHRHGWAINVRPDRLEHIRRWASRLRRESDCEGVTLRPHGACRVTMWRVAVCQDTRVIASGPSDPGQWRKSPSVKEGDPAICRVSESPNTGPGF
jgi:hypothetical protein